jgi:GTP pyrophosphokinase
VKNNFSEEEARLIGKAWAFGGVKHEGQLRNEGKPYFESHCVPVYHILSKVTNDADILCAGLLHDTIEDTDATYEELCIEFNQRIADLVMEVTDEGKADNYGKYFPRLKTREGIMIKFADRLHNISSMDSWDIGRQKHYLKKSKFWKSESPQTSLIRNREIGTTGE